MLGPTFPGRLARYCHAATKFLNSVQPSLDAAAGINYSMRDGERQGVMMCPSASQRPCAALSSAIRAKTSRAQQSAQRAPS